MSPNGRATVFGAVCVSKCGFESFHSSKKTKMESSFRTKRLHGYQTKKAFVAFSRPSPRLRIWVEQREDLGFIQGWTLRTSSRHPLRLVYLRYSKEGIPSRSVLRFLSRPSRAFSVSSRSLWGNSGDHGVYLLRTSKGRQTHVQGRNLRLGGTVSVWIK